MKTRTNKVFKAIVFLLIIALAGAFIYYNYTNEQFRKFMFIKMFDGARPFFDVMAAAVTLVIALLVYFHAIGVQAGNSADVDDKRQNAENNLNTLKFDAKFDADKETETYKDIEEVQSEFESFMSEINGIRRAAIDASYKGISKQRRAAFILATISVLTIISLFNPPIFQNQILVCYVAFWLVFCYVLIFKPASKTNDYQSISKHATVVLQLTHRQARTTNNLNILRAELEPIRG
ncbi:MAG: hypothetical protein HRU29_11555 [Rhizobiales bacterium]|nr:hypothetical protein [Hyphomicrobiales bacterium]NRB15025.1 hypothetical protein [Hyphomicrobiales bacterium]